MILCPFCGAYSPRSCDLIDDAGCCPWEEAEEEGLSIATEPEDERNDDDELG
jgi:hypothetical protein